MTCLHCQEDQKIWDLMAGKRKSVDLDASLEAFKTYCEKHRLKTITSFKESGWDTKKLEAV